MTAKTVINASEIAQYSYCPVAWYLQRQGHKPESPFLMRGNEVHAEMGEKIAAVQEKEKTARRISNVGLFLLVIAVLGLIIGWLAI